MERARKEIPAPSTVPSICFGVQSMYVKDSFDNNT
jgi:hypothetical protein